MQHIGNPEGNFIHLNDKGYFAFSLSSFQVDVKFCVSRPCGGDLAFPFFNANDVTFSYGSKFQGCSVLQDKSFMGGGPRTKRQCLLT